MKRYLPILILVFLSLSCSSEYDYVRGGIKDDVLAYCLIRQMYQNDFTELTQVIELNCQKGVSDLTGINQLTHLEKLYLQDNELENLLTLGELPSLKVIYLAGSETLTSLQGLEGASNLEEIQANKTPQLNDITSVAHLNNLTVFAAMMANIKDVSAFTDLNQLKKVVLNYNSIDSLAPLGNKDSLEWLEAYSNPIRDLNGIENNKNLKLFGIDKGLSGLCSDVILIRNNLSDDARVYGPVNCR